MLKMRLGAVPLIEVNTPWPPAVSTSYRSSQYGAIKLFMLAVGRQRLLNALLLLVNCRLPFDEMLTEVKV